MTDDGQHEIQRVADTIAATLRAHGVRQAFGMPGGEVVTLIDALVKAGIAFHLARHETAAALMAAGVCQVTQAPALLVTTVGPGLANAVNGIADAAQEHVPLVVISGVVDRPTRARYTHQVIDQASLMRPLVKASFEIEPESAAATVARALALATSAPMGPVHLDLSPQAAASTAPLEPRAIAPPRLRVPTIAANDPAVSDLAKRLARAQRPLILAGYEAARAGAGSALLTLAEQLEAPVITTYKGKGTIDEHHRLALGGAGLSPLADRVLLGLLKKSDLVLFAGYDPIEMRLGWLDPGDDPEKIVEITAAPADHGMHHAAERIVGPVTQVLNALIDLIGLVEAPRWPDGEPARARQMLEELFRSPSGWGPHSIVDTLNETAGPDAIVTVDSGAHRILLSQKWRAQRPLALLQSAGFCTMAAALPLAIGAKIAEPGRQVIAVMGDGGLEMGIGELATLRDCGLPITIVVFQDESLALIELKQAQAGLSQNGVRLGLTDFATIAAGFGGHGETVSDQEHLRQALSAARTRDSFTLIACRFEADAYKNAF